jgi:hypothetical protein
VSWRDWWANRCITAKIWSRRTTIMGYVTVCWAVLELNPDTVGQWVTAPRRGIVLLVIGMINAALGHYNQSLINQRNRDAQ